MVIRVLIEKKKTSDHIARPGVWNKKTLQGVRVAMVRETETPAELHVLRDQAQDTLQRAREATRLDLDAQKNTMIGRPADVVGLAFATPRNFQVNF